VDGWFDRTCRVLRTIGQAGTVASTRCGRYGPERTTTGDPALAHGPPACILSGDDLAPVPNRYIRPAGSMLAPASVSYRYARSERRDQGSYVLIRHDAPTTIGLQVIICLKGRARNEIEIATMDEVLL
jgi:hypothetical protein